MAKRRSYFEVSECPKIVNPLTVASKVDGNTGEIKKRLCIDLSRSLNPLLADLSTRMDNFNDLLQITEEKDFFMLSDFRSMFTSLKLNPACWELFGFSFIVEGRKRFFVMARLPFGLKTSCSICEILIRPLRNFLYEISICLSLYIDDACVKNKCKSLCLYQNKTYRFLAQCCGWSFSIEKCSSKPVNVIYFLGFFLNSIDMKVTISEMKQLYILNILEKTNEAYYSRKEISCKWAAHVCGHLAHVIPAFGPMIRVVSRGLQHALGREVVRSSWDGKFYVTQNIINELIMCKTVIENCNGQPVQKIPVKLSIDSPVLDSFTIQIDPKLTQLIENIVVSDSSDQFSYTFDVKKKTFLEIEFNENEKQSSSTYRELLSIRFFLENKPEFFKEYKDKCLIWLTDSQCLFYIFNRGSRIKELQKIILEIYVELFKLNIQLIIKWRPRQSTLIKCADLGSKFTKKSDDYGVCHHSLSEALQFFGINKIDVDCFATDLSKRSEVFWAAIPCPGVAAINFFCQHLEENVLYYAHPPISLIAPTLAKILNSKAEVILSVPLWTTRLFMTLIRGSGKYKPFVKSVFYAKPNYVSFRSKTMFSGFKNFWHLFLLISPGGNYEICY